MAKTGYLYALVHPSDPDLYKVGVTILEPGKRLAQHNRNFDEYAGKIVKETGQPWELKTYIEVTSPSGRKDVLGSNAVERDSVSRKRRSQEDEVEVGSAGLECGNEGRRATATAAAKDASAKPRMDGGPVVVRRHRHDR